MFTEQSFRLPGEGKKFIARDWNVPFQEDQEDFKATMDEIYKKAARTSCRHLMAPCRGHFPFQDKSSQN
ncbi:MAG: hypothetical protein PHN75_18675 [Syntrophales bacterium]|nr:hypothetical protein [Syntrophales bacterium]